MVPGSSNYIGNNDRFQLFAQVTEKINLTNVMKISLIFSIQDDCARRILALFLAVACGLECYMGIRWVWVKYQLDLNRCLC